MPNTVPAAATGLPFANPDEPAFEVTDAGRAYLLLEDSTDASPELPPALAAELAALKVEAA
jgi:hypothetical protein